MHSTTDVLKSRFRYTDRTTGESRTTISELLAIRPDSQFRLDASFRERYLTQQTTWPDTFVSDIKREEIRSPNEPAVFETPDSIEAFLDRWSAKYQNTGEAIIALSGGTDSQVLARHLQQRGITLRAYHLRSGLSNYCEWNRVSEFARQFQIAIEPIDVSEASFAEGACELIRAMQIPIYGLHAVSKWLFFKRISERGELSVISGDGADQIFDGKSECDLFPITRFSADAHGVALDTPFASEFALQTKRASTSLITKESLQQYALTLGLPLREKLSARLDTISGWETPELCFANSINILREHFVTKGN